MAEDKPTTVDAPRGDKPNIDYIDAGKLLLDPKNPRLLVEPSAKQDTLLRKLFESEALEELAYSIAACGFFVEEPLVVIPDEEQSGHFTVVEGNRRFATVQILCSPELRANLKPSRWPELDSATKTSLETLPCVVRKNREEVEAFLVFRHITGIKRWDYFQKSRYVSGLIEKGLTIDEIEQRIGDDVGTIKKLYQSFLVFRHVRDDISMDTGPLLQSFSLLEVALGQRPIKSFLGLPHRLPSERCDGIVPDDRLANLQEVITWIFGDTERGLSRVISDSRDINGKLSPTIANPVSLGYLRETRDLDAAFERSSDEREYLNKQLLAAERALKRALGEAPSFKGDAGTQERVEKLRSLVESIAELVE